MTTCMAANLVKGEGFAVDASVMEANASRYHGKPPDELNWTDAQRQKRAVAEYLAALDAEARAETERIGADAGGDGMPEVKPTASPRRSSRHPIPNQHGRPRPTSACSSAMGSTI